MLNYDEWIDSDRLMIANKSNRAKQMRLNAMYNETINTANWNQFYEKYTEKIRIEVQNYIENERNCRKFSKETIEFYVLIDELRLNRRTSDIETTLNENNVDQRAGQIVYDDANYPARRYVYGDMELIEGEGYNCTINPCCHEPSIKKIVEDLVSYFCGKNTMSSVKNFLVRLLSQEIERMFPNELLYQNEMNEFKALSTQNVTDVYGAIHLLRSLEKLPKSTESGTANTANLSIVLDRTIGSIQKYIIKHHIFTTVYTNV
ncbi:hypothetical protein ACOME3_009783 [Neoechinorhynchus agilis]